MARRSQVVFREIRMASISALLMVGLATPWLALQPMFHTRTVMVAGSCDGGPNGGPTGRGRGGPNGGPNGNCSGTPPPPPVIS